MAYGGRDDKLFRAAISESGFSSATAPYPSLDQWQPVYDYVISATNCTSASDSLACLRTIPSAALSAVFNSTFNGSNIGSESTFGPQVDGDFLQMSGTTQLRNGHFVKVPYLLGTNFDEGTSFGTQGLNTTADFINETLSQTPGMDNATLNTILKLYPDDPDLGIPSTLHGRPSPKSGYGAQWKREAAYWGDVKMQAARRHAAESWARYNTTAYTYHFDVVVNGATPEEGAGHFREVAFVFDDTIGLGYNNSVSEDPFVGEPETLKDLAKMMSRMWVGFIVDLDPNSAESECLQVLLLSFQFSTAFCLNLLYRLCSCDKCSRAPCSLQGSCSCSSAVSCCLFTHTTGSELLLTVFLLSSFEHSVAQIYA